MLSSVKNFFLTFVISLLLFALMAYLIVGLVLKNLNSSMNGNSGSETEAPRSEQTDPTSGKIIDFGDSELGRSFNVLIVGTDYRENTFADYDPEMLKELYGIEPEREGAAEIPRDLRNPKKATGILSDGSMIPDAGVPTTDGALAFKGGFYTIDYRVIEADTVIMLRFDKERGHISYTVFPTDAFVDIGGRYVKLSEVYGRYGYEALEEKIHALTGINIDCHALISMDKFPALIDALGGINYYVPCNMNYDDYAGNVHIHLRAGRQMLNGDQALQLLMFNSYEDPSNSRILTTMSFIKAMFTGMTSINNYSRAGDLFEAIDGMMETDFTAQDFAENLDMIFKYAGNQIEIGVTTKQITDNGEKIIVINEQGTLNIFSDYRKIYK